MAVTNKFAELALMASYGDASNHLVNLVMAAEKAFDNYGKRSIFGRDKGKEAEKEFTAAIMRAVIALENVGKIRDSSDAVESLTALHNAIELVKIAYPNWPRAYKYFDDFYAGL